MKVVHPSPTQPRSTRLPSSRSVIPGLVFFNNSSKPASLSAAPMRSQSISSSDLMSRRRMYSASRLATEYAFSRSAHFLCASGPIRPTRFAPRRFSSSSVFSMPRCSPQRTSQSRASFFASGKWLYHSTCIVICWPGRITTYASTVPGQPVTHCGALPARWPVTISRWSRPRSSISAASARGRRAYSASEKRGYSCSTMARRCCGRLIVLGTRGAHDRSPAPQLVGDEGGELLRVEAVRRDAFVAQLLLHVRNLQRAPHFAVQPLDDLRRQARRPGEREPHRRHQVRVTGFGKGGNVGILGQPR